MIKNEIQPYEYQQILQKTNECIQKWMQLKRECQQTNFQLSLNTIFELPYIWKHKKTFSLLVAQIKHQLTRLHSEYTNLIHTYKQLLYHQNLEACMYQQKINVDKFYLCYFEALNTLEKIHTVQEHQHDYKLTFIYKLYSVFSFYIQNYFYFMLLVPICMSMFESFSLSPSTTSSSTIQSCIHSLWVTITTIILKNIHVFILLLNLFVVGISNYILFWISPIFSCLVLLSSFMLQTKFLMQPNLFLRLQPYLCLLSMTIHSYFFTYIEGSLYAQSFPTLLSIIPTYFHSSNANFAADYMLFYTPFINEWIQLLGSKAASFIHISLHDICQLIIQSLVLGSSSILSTCLQSGLQKLIHFISFNAYQVASFILQSFIACVYSFLYFESFSKVLVALQNLYVSLILIGYIYDFIGQMIVLLFPSLPLSFSKLRSKLRLDFSALNNNEFDEIEQYFLL